MSLRSLKDLLLLQPPKVGPENMCTSSLLAELRSLVPAEVPTLEQLFAELPTDLGFDVELKYPYRSEDADIFGGTEGHAGLVPPHDINHFVDRILDVVLHDRKADPSAATTTPADGDGSSSCLTNRRIVFSSFSPLICQLLRHKQSRYPVLYLTEGGTSGGCNDRSLHQAMLFAKAVDLPGIVTECRPLCLAPGLIGWGRNVLGLSIIGSYGKKNNEDESNRLQLEHGLDVLITDRVGPARIIMVAQNR